mmetsp:Transcript_38983/g.80952  ORF Transcript_38983/g.80952 Transcript_38983/m.80952 type:complete len:223 (-) Transcript_38983:532-1200(-)|eukprot:CAMPEP_0172460128 /NCGR_PEP_ID=MMETSP1065-20121228/35632_1 /TAXON_ID=265537 /ORGANISM="Amphiprora paludosa, Strain CCMP125" /LENGTH=222 /DNA_ID=CAMNT_0013215065 /DNA_START=323 /DNA_END=991 /DNA_ORIENTATION=-
MEKPKEFQQLYARANPLPGARPKVPVLEIWSPASDDGQEKESLVLCESTVIVEYLWEEFDQDSHLVPTKVAERAQSRLFLELCGSSFSSYISFSRVANMEQVERERTHLEKEMQKVNAFLAATYPHHDESLPFTMAECFLAPFVQRCCAILPPPYDPLSIGQNLQLEHLQFWIQSTVLGRPSVQNTASADDWQRSRQKLEQRLVRLQQKARAESETADSKKG